MEKPLARVRGSVPLEMVFELMHPEFSEAVVERALRFRAKASTRVRGAMENTLRSAVKIRGYRDASKAQPQLLVGPVLEEIKQGHGRLAGAILRVWDESQGALREVVAERLRRAGVSLAKPDYKASRFAATWPMDEWTMHREALASEHGQFDEDSVALMLCLVSGRAPVPELDEALCRIESDFFRAWTLQLLELPAESPAWLDIDPFTSAACEIAVKKSQEKVENETKAVAQAIDHIQEKHKDEIKYLGLDVRLWFAEVKQRLDLVPEALNVLRGLQRELEAYRPVRPQGSSLEEERRRAKERTERENAILAFAREWAEVTAKPAKVAEVAEQRAVYSARGASDASKEVEFLRSEVSRWKDDHDNLAAKLAEESNQRAQLQEANGGLQLEKKQMKDTLSALEEELAESKNNEQYWREQAHEAMKTQEDSDESAEPAQFATLADAIARAEEEFQGELLIKLNGKSRIDMPFQKPQEVFAALAWLATEFHRERPDGVNPDFTLSIRKACPGWFYKPNQTKTTMGMYADWYRTTVNGKTFELSNHIGKGNSFDRKSTIRIAFAWDSEQERVVVGYVGPHQKNRQS